ncbi:hypothetical protein BKA66DRAFT_454626 [Pyrenochaeta sp. MPI-SDFR-AT-0127]|nr:hypothetical protein BKA66DRAFT_454626 [Pyrenochaeta sp. MPI-SDFR-AT-0127]
MALRRNLGVYPARRLGSRASPEAHQLPVDSRPILSSAGHCPTVTIRTTSTLRAHQRRTAENRSPRNLVPALGSWADQRGALTAASQSPARSQNTHRHTATSSAPVPSPHRYWNATCGYDAACH